MTRAKQQVAKGQFAAVVDGQQVVVLEGAQFPVDHPVVKENPAQFGSAAAVAADAKARLGD
jgi:hypothetical protein